jgi:hypothetical protein
MPKRTAFDDSDEQCREAHMEFLIDVFDNMKALGWSTELMWYEHEHLGSTTLWSIADCLKRVAYHWRVSAWYRTHYEMFVLIVEEQFGEGEGEGEE